MTDQGCVVLTAQNITDGTVTVTPAAPPSAGVSRVNFEHQILKHIKVIESPRKTDVDGATLVITLDKHDRVGRKLCWTSYE